MENTETKTITVHKDATVTTSEKFTINWQDAAKGMLMAVIAPVLYLIEQTVDASIEAGQMDFVFPWRGMIYAAIAGGVAYLIKNFFTPSQIVVKPPKPE